MTRENPLPGWARVYGHTPEPVILHPARVADYMTAMSQGGSMNAAQEPRRFALALWSDGKFTLEYENSPVWQRIAPPEAVPVIEASAYDALLAERDALKAKLADTDAHSELLESTLASADATIDALREKARAWDALAASLKESGHESGDYLMCDDVFGLLYCDAEQAAMSDARFPLHYVTTSATESREAKGGTT